MSSIVFLNSTDVLNNGGRDLTELFSSLILMLYLLIEIKVDNSTRNSVLLPADLMNIQYALFVIYCFLLEDTINTKITNTPIVVLFSNCHSASKRQKSIGSPVVH